MGIKKVAMSILDALNKNIKWNHELKESKEEINNDIANMFDNSEDGIFLGQLVANLFEMDEINKRYGLIKEN